MEMQTNRKKKFLKYGAYSSLFVFVILGFIVVFNYLSTLWFQRLDLTEGKEYSVTAATIKTLRDLDDIVNIKVFFSKKLPSQMLPTTKRVRDLLSEYRAFSRGNLRITYLDPGADPKIEQEAKSLGLQPVRMDAIEKDQRQIITGYLGMAIQYADKKELLPLVSDTRDLEYNLTSAIKKVIREEDPAVGILKGYGAPPLDSICRRFNDNLKKVYKIEEVTVKEGRPIDKNLGALVVMGPENVPERVKFEIDQYVMSGGKLVAWVDGVTISHGRGLTASDRFHNMNDLLGHYGARVEQNLVLDRSCAMASFQTQVAPGFFSYFSTPYPLWTKFLAGFLNQESPVINRLAGMILPWASSVEITIDSADTSRNIEAIVLAQTTKASWTMQGTYNLDPQSKFDAPEGLKMSRNMVVALAGEFESYYKDKEIPRFSRKITDENGDEREVDTLRAEDKNRKIIAKSPETRVFVVGNSRFISDQFVQQSGGINLNLALNIVDWMAQDESLITIRTRRVIDRPLKETTPAKRSIIRWANLLVVPILLIVFGLSKIALRRKKLRKVIAGGNA